MDSPQLTAHGGGVGIGPLRRELVETYWRWESDPVVMRGYGRTEPESLADRQAGLEVQLHGDNAHFTVYELTGAQPRPVGIASLSIDRAVRVAEFFICLGSEGRGHGYAAPAVRLVLEYGFDRLGLRNVLLNVLAPNSSALRAYENAGFRVVGRRRDSGYWDGERCDEIVMDAVPGDVTAGVAGGCSRA
ncbi:GNAT family N-acetyltransferase [Streptomyces sp. NPDC092296]|uniref:GNAT family N-acetyltransferase n=1 Tax=Streptomyces sp. NPDC092296 TaxID=3366012 RepID=UPI003812D970